MRFVPAEQHTAVLAEWCSRHGQFEAARRLRGEVVRVEVRSEFWGQTLPCDLPRVPTAARQDAWLAEQRTRSEQR